MITYIDLPLRGTYTVNGHDVLVIALVVKRMEAGAASDDYIGVVFVDQDGSMGEALPSEININWRFDDRRRKWVDVDTGEDLDDDGEGSD